MRQLIDCVKSVTKDLNTDVGKVIKEKRLQDLL